MKYKLRLIMILSLVLAFSALLIIATAFGVESAMTGVVILAWLIGLSLLNLGLKALMRLVDILVKRHVAMNSGEKPKRNYVDTILHDLSDSDLMRLKRRLVDGTIDDNVLQEQLVGDDGELVYMEKNG